MTQTKQSQIVFLDGKEIALKALCENTFHFLAIGHADEDNGFQNPDTDTGPTGFNEITAEEDPTYERIPLIPYGKTVKDIDSGKVLCKFTADLDIDNIQRNIKINQFAIVNTKTVGDVNTKIYAASTFTSFLKDNSIAITFVIGLRL